MLLNGVWFFVDELNVMEYGNRKWKDGMDLCIS